MRLVFVHGMRQERKDPVALRQEWEDALNAAWAKAGLARPNYTLEMPFYGDVLNDLTEAVRGPTDAVVKRGEGGPGLFTPDEEALILEIKRHENISDAEVNAELGQEVVARGPANWEWVQAIGRVLERPACRASAASGSASSIRSMPTCHAGTSVPLSTKS